MTKEELLKQRLGCPFCGELPELHERRGRAPVELYCGNRECYAQVEVRSKNGDYEELLTKWNTRAVGLFPQWSAEERKEAGDAFDVVMKLFNKV